MIPLKILTRACAEIIVEQPKKIDAVMTSLGQILSRYGKLRRAAVTERIIEDVARRLEITRYRVVSADTLSPQDQARIARTMSDTKSDIIYTTNTQLLGGMIVKTKDKILDLSLKNKINQLKNTIEK
jgi:F0F1-type ATP synthase delta subunit